VRREGKDIVREGNKKEIKVAARGAEKKQSNVPIGKENDYFSLETVTKWTYPV